MASKNDSPSEAFNRWISAVYSKISLLFSRRKMATEATEPAPVFPDYMLDPDAVLKDTANWRHGSSPNYSGTRKVYEASESISCCTDLLFEAAVEADFPFLRSNS